ncbi:hypothetical protein HanPI659440_Chr03g0110861 [Helianthus annuus]|nr:hypothetical protein HanPI659440_Chr03g0110861 [Helianthus annuus]
MADSNSQPPRTVAGGTETLIDHPGSPLNVVPHNLSPVFAFNEDEDASFEVRVVEEPEPISSAFPASVLNQNSTNDDEDGVQNCTFTQLLSTGDFCLCETMIFFL